MRSPTVYCATGTPAATTMRCPSRVRTRQRSLTTCVSDEPFEIGRRSCCSFVPAMGGTLPQGTKKRTGLGPHPWQGKSRESQRIPAAYVRRSELMEPLPARVVWISHSSKEPWCPCHRIEGNGIGTHLGRGEEINCHRESTTIATWC